MQEPLVIPQDALPDSNAPVLLLASSSALATDEALLKQVRHPSTFQKLKNENQLTLPFSSTGTG